MDRPLSVTAPALPDVRPHARRRARRRGARRSRSDPRARGWSACSASARIANSTDDLRDSHGCLLEAGGQVEDMLAAGRFPVLTKLGLLDLHDDVPGGRPPRARRAGAVAGRPRRLQHARHDAERLPRRHVPRRGLRALGRRLRAVDRPRARAHVRRARPRRRRARAGGDGGRRRSRARRRSSSGSAATRSTCTSTSTCSTPTSCPSQFAVAARAERHRPAHAAGRGRPRVRRRRARDDRVRGPGGPGGAGPRTPIVAGDRAALLP